MINKYRQKLSDDGNRSKCKKQSLNLASVSCENDEKWEKKLIITQNL